MSLADINFDYDRTLKDKFVCKTCGKTYSMMGPHLEGHYKKHLAEGLITDPIPTKICSRCQIEKPTTEFYIDRHARSGFRPDCIECHRQYIRERGKKERGGVKLMGETANLSTKILKRFLKEDEFKALFNKYQENKKISSSLNRATFLNVGITDEEKELITFYCLETDKPLYDYSEESKKYPGKFYGRVQRASVKVLYRLLKANPNLLNELPEEVQ